jgi:hypothetical protein
MGTPRDIKVLPPWIEIALAFNDSDLPTLLVERKRL